jgi:hypothetical protein
MLMKKSQSLFQIIDGDVQYQYHDHEHLHDRKEDREVLHCNVIH